MGLNNTHECDNCGKVFVAKCPHCMKLRFPMKCIYCKRKIHKDLEGDLIHDHLDTKGVDPRMCQPINPDSKIATKGVR